MNQLEEKYSDAVLQAVDAGRKIEAIKLLREETGLGLKDAKHAIDKLIRDRRRATEGHSAMSEQGGADALIKMVALIVALIALYKVFVAN